MGNAVRERWAAGAAALDCWVSGQSIVHTEAVGRLGFDSVLIDMQHTAAEYRDVLASVIALAATPTVPLVRVPSLDPGLIGRVLDAGARGVMCPMVNTPQQAQAFVAACRYPPAGTRSWGAYRAMDPDAYFSGANTDMLTIGQIETIPALDAVADIAAVEGLDVLYAGPTDLSISAGGRPVMDYTDPVTVERHARIVATAHAAGKRAGMLAPGPDDAAIGLGWGMDLVSVAMEQRLVTEGAAAALARARAAERA